MPLTPIQIVGLGPKGGGGGGGGGGGPALMLNELSLSANSIVENSANNTVVGNLNNRTANSTLTLIDDAGGRFKLVNPASTPQIQASSVTTNYEAATYHNIVVEEALSGYTSRRTTLTILVGDVQEGSPNTLNELAVASPKTVVEGSAPNTVVGAVLNRTAGSTLTLTDTAGGRFKLVNPTTSPEIQTDTVATNYTNNSWHNIVIQESLSGYPTRSTTVTIVVLDDGAGGATNLFNELTLSNNAVTEGAANNTAVGVISGRTSGSTLTLTNDAGGRFKLVNPTTVSPEIQCSTTATDFEANKSHNIVVQEAMSGYVTRTTTITIVVLDNTADSTLAELALATNTVNEGAANNTVVGNVTGRTNGSTLTLTNDAGGRFKLVNPTTTPQIQCSTTVTDYETDKFHNITIQEALSGYATRSTTLTVVVVDVPELTFNALTLTNTAVNEAVAQGFFIADIQGKTSGSFLTLTVDGGGRFQISGTQLQAGATPTDYETATSHGITIMESALNYVTRQTSFTITVNDVLEPLGALTLSASALDEGAAQGTVVGNVLGRTSGSTLSLIDDAGGRFQLANQATTPQIQAGATSTDNPPQLSYNITIRETKTGFATRDTTLTININDLPETFNNITLSPSTVPEGTGPNVVVGNLSGATAGSTLQMTDTAGGRFKLSGAQVQTDTTVTDYETATSHNIIIQESKAGYTTKYNTITISVSDVAETFNTLTLSASTVAEESAANTVVGTLQGVTSGSTLTLTDSAGGRFAVNGLNQIVTGSVPTDYEVASSHLITVQESKTGYTTKTTNFTITVTNITESGTTPWNFTYLPSGYNDFNITDSTRLVGTAPAVTAVKNHNDTIQLSVNGGTLTRESGQWASGVTSLDFPGTDNAPYLRHTDQLFGHCWWFMVLKKATQVTGGSSNQRPIMQVCAADGNGLGMRLQFLRPEDDSPQTRLDALGVGSGGTTVTTNDFGLVRGIVGLRFTSSAPDFRVNGGTFRTGLNFGAATTGITEISFGHEATVTARRGKFKLVRIVQVNLTNATLSDFEKVEGYLAWQHWNRADADWPLPSGHPYYNAAPSVTIAPPVTDITISNNTIAEGSASGTLVGTLESVPAGGTFELLDPVGGRFALNGANIVAGSTPTDYETLTSHTIQVRATRQGQQYTKDIVIQVTNVTEITDITLSPSTIAENSAPGTVIGTLTSTPAGGTFQIVGGADGNRFQLVNGNQVACGTTNIDYEVDGADRTITVRGSMNGLTFDKTIHITITNVNEGGSGTNLVTESGTNITNESGVPITVS